jgi:hypothetical protein
VDEQTAWEVFTAGQQISVTIDGHRVDGVLVTGLNISSRAPQTMDLLLPTKIGEAQRRIRVAISKVELSS